MKLFWLELELDEEGRDNQDKNQLSALPDCEPDGRVLRLIRDGIVRPARAESPRALFTDQPPRPNAGASAVEALLDERRKGR